MFTTCLERRLIQFHLPARQQNGILVLRPFHSTVPASIGTSSRLHEGRSEAQPDSRALTEGTSMTPEDRELSHISTIPRVTMDQAESLTARPDSSRKYTFSHLDEMDRMLGLDGPAPTDPSSQVHYGSSECVHLSLPFIKSW